MTLPDYSSVWLIKIFNYTLVIRFGACKYLTSTRPKYYPKTSSCFTVLH